jgi:hypothetical protein
LGIFRDRPGLYRDDAGDKAATVAIECRPTTFFDLFPDERGRRAHLTGRVAAALGARSADLLSADPVIEPFDTLASKPHA